MNTIRFLETILERMQKCPKNLVRVELEMFQNALERDPHLNTVLSAIERSNEPVLGNKVANIVNDMRVSSWADLSFANSAPLRTVVGYQACRVLLNESNPMKCGNKVEQLGAFYKLYQRDRGGAPTPAEAIRVFSEVFLHPLLAYLRGVLETHDDILLLLSRYKRPTEWFPDPVIGGGAKSGEEKTEEWLKNWFLRYLFDNGIDFSIEAETLAVGGETDVLITLPDLGPLSLEAKVFDGNSRGSSYVSGGFAQAADYARKFNHAIAYFIAYNIVPDTLLVLPGTTTGRNVTPCKVQGVDVYSIAINMKRTLPSNRARGLKVVDIPLPPDKG